MPGKSNKLFWWVFGIHATIIGGLLVAPLFHRRPKEIVTFVEYVSEPAAGEIQPAGAERLPEPKPIVEAPKQAPIPEPKPEPEKPKRKPNPVVRQNKRIVIGSEKPAPVSPSPKRITSSDIRNALGSTRGLTSPFATYYTTVRERMYGVWKVPVGVAYGLSAQASITIGADGSISNRQLIRPSGNTAFDQSVQSALNAVNRLPRPPANLPSRTITIEFVPQ